MANPNWKTLLPGAALIAAAGLWVFAPALRGGWLMDDDLYVTQNVLLNDPARLWKIWFSPGSLIEYYPVEASVQAVQWHLWRMNPVGYHVTNVILHILGGLLLWRLLSKFGLRLAWLGGFLFVVHPAAVESVAWISELKNTLSLPPFLLAACAWIDYENRKSSRDYFLALGFFLVAMLCKISMALFPVVILLYAWWKRDRIVWGDLRASAPFFAISFALGLGTIWAGDAFRASHLQSLSNPDIGDCLTRAALAGTAILFYFSKAVCPIGMLPIYPKWAIHPHSLIFILPWFVLGGALFWFWRNRAGWGRHALLGVGFFLLNLLPFVGLTSISYMGFTWVMDHFLYVPLIGLVGLATAGLENLERLVSGLARKIVAITASVVLALLAWESHNYAAIFAGPETLWTYTLQHNSTSWLAHNNLGNIFLETNRIPEAINQYQASLQFNPQGVEANNNLGFALFQEGRTSEAIEHYNQALKFNPHFALAHTNLADALASTGRVQEAIRHEEEALLINPGDSAVRANLTKLKAMSIPSSP